jgi:hypothetical protein
MAPRSASGCKAGLKAAISLSASADKLGMFMTHLSLSGQL